MHEYVVIFLQGVGLYLAVGVLVFLGAVALDRPRGTFSMGHIPGYLIGLIASVFMWPAFLFVWSRKPR